MAISEPLVVCAFATNLYHIDKFDARAIKCVFLGYPYAKKGYKLIDLKIKKCFNIDM